jgi:hypothetical protein
VLAVRFLRTWDLFQTSQMVNYAEGRSLHAERAGIVCYFLMLLLVPWGIVVLRRRGQPLWILLMPFVMVSLVSIAWYGIPRFRHAAEIPIIVLASVSAVDLAGRLAARRRARHGSGEPVAVAGGARP